MVSKNKLLGSGVLEEEEEVAESANVSVKLYREDVPEGRVFEGAEMIEMMKRKLWTEDPPEAKKKEEEEEEEEEEDNDSKPNPWAGKGSKIDDSGNEE